MSDRKILFRLLRKQEGGSFKVVGYMKIEHGKIFHSFEHLNWGAVWINILIQHKMAIEFDRADQFTGTTDEDGVRIFERDSMHRGTEERVILFNEGRFCMVKIRTKGGVSISAPWDLYRNARFFRVTGIQGVK